jgi:hypothetical protein
MRLGETMLDFVTHDDARPALSAVRLEGRTALTYGELAELIGELIGKYKPEFVVPAPGVQRGSSQPAGEIYIDPALLLAISGAAGRPKTADRR